MEEGLSDIREISRYNGKEAVGLGIVKQHGSNAVEVAKDVRNKVDQIRKTLLPGYHIDVKLDQTKFIKDSVDELNMTLLLSAILTSIICFLFLGSWSSTINVLFAIPTSIVGAFIALYFFGFTLNTFTLLGLSLAIGIVVDDAIMMLENIVRHYEMGKNRRQAALDGAEEITFAALATTLAIAAIFIPVVFMKGVVGRFLLPIWDHGDGGGISFLARSLDADADALRAFSSLREIREPGFHLENHGCVHGFSDRSYTVRLFNRRIEVALRGHSSLRLSFSRLRCSAFDVEKRTDTSSGSIFVSAYH